MDQVLNPMTFNAPVTLSRTGSAYITVYCIRWRNHQSVRFGRRRTTHMNVNATNMGRLPRTLRNELYNHDNGSIPYVERMKRTNNKLMFTGYNEHQRKNTEQPEDIYRKIRTHIGQLPNMCIRHTRFHSVSSLFRSLQDAQKFPTN